MKSMSNGAEVIQEKLDMESKVDKTASTLDDVRAEFIQRQEKMEVEMHNVKHMLTMLVEKAGMTPPISS